MARVFSLLAYFSFPSPSTFVQRGTWKESTVLEKGSVDVGGTHI